MSITQLMERAEISLEKTMGMKQRPDYHPVLDNITTHTHAPYYKADHQLGAFNDYWRNPLKKQDKLIIDPNIKQKSYLSDQQKKEIEDASYVKLLSKNDGEPSDELIVEKTGKGAQKKK